MGRELCPRQGNEQCWWDLAAVAVPSQDVHHEEAWWEGAHVPFLLPGLSKDSGVMVKEVVMVFLCISLGVWCCPCEGVMSEWWGHWASWVTQSSPQVKKVQPFRADWHLNPAVTSLGASLSQPPCLMALAPTYSLTKNVLHSYHSKPRQLCWSCEAAGTCWYPVQAAGAPLGPSGEKDWKKRTVGLVCILCWSISLLPFSTLWKELPVSSPIRALVHKIPQCDPSASSFGCARYQSLSCPLLIPAN